MLDGHPCKIIELATSKPGKHGSAKVAFTGIDIFTAKKVEAIHSTEDHVVVPVVKKFELEVADISQDNFVSFILPDSSLKEDLKLPNDKKEAKKLKEAF
jgi:translation initiation factor 5A